MEWIKVYFAENEIEAKLIKGQLESEGLKVQLTPKSSESIIQSPFLHTSLSIPFEIFVPKSQKDQAEAILNSEKP